MGRELRRVPADWEHPKSDNGSFQPMFDEYYGDALDNWFKKNEQWENGTHPDLIKNPELKEKYPFFAMWGGNPPDVEFYQKRKFSEEELTHIQAYKNTTEGTPITPVFRADQLDDLCMYCEENKISVFGKHTQDAESWRRLFAGQSIGFTIGNVIFV